ncbi:hypothetical protein KIN20_015522 [Parelaphostrongylus tenuis]|uniref:Uncharacterized protein n=1 Tax=Parelaphostrongylus tenuis TaxID=148309 RepID=A0AAD5QQ07_PARTN|nr:hypothetical protein KIN20_015522 [Parelaphostrongylus tenuis]
MTRNFKSFQMATTQLNVLASGVCKATWNAPTAFSTRPQATRYSDEFCLVLKPENSNSSCD